MASEKILYWMAVGLLTIFVGNHFITKYSVECLADRSPAILQHLSSQAGHLVAMAQSMLGRTSIDVPVPEMALAGAQTRLASVQSLMARQEAACARVEAERARTMVLQQMQQMRFSVICPRQSSRLRFVPAPVIPTDGTI